MKEKHAYDRLKIICQALFYPGFKFVYNYFWRLGFLDGFAGFI